MKTKLTTTKKRPKAGQRRALGPATGSAIPFVNKDGHVMRLSRSMTLRELLKMGVVEIHLAKPGTPLREGEWRYASPSNPSLNKQDEPRP